MFFIEKLKLNFLIKLGAKMGQIIKKYQRIAPIHLTVATPLNNSIPSHTMAIPILNCHTIVFELVGRELEPRQSLGPPISHPIRYPMEFCVHLTLNKQTVCGLSLFVEQTETTDSSFVRLFVCLFVCLFNS